MDNKQYNALFSFVWNIANDVLVHAFEPVMQEVTNEDGTKDIVERLPGLDNHTMGTIFEELLRKFNEENSYR
jgi:type I restriction enzyme M protein